MASHETESDGQEPQSSQLKRVREYYELVDSGRVRELVELFADNAEYHRPGYEPLQGRAGLGNFYQTRRVIRDGAHAQHGRGSRRLRCRARGVQRGTA
ncbi:nuclear transport factor 2 family protein [Streptomyces sp. NPDC005181]|uniref:nuclear transport factor 2 family protein n=1 Tax=Streptomyces sp. NPDC005181 TaxID=3156869 RepID=UPI0033AA32DD